MRQRPCVQGVTVRVREEHALKEQRKKTRAPLDVYVNKYVGGVPYTARTSDISEDGMRLAKLIEPRSSRKRVGLQFQLPGSEEIIYAEGEVVREWASLQSGAEGSGIRFTHLSERHRELIGAYVAPRLDTPGVPPLDGCP